MGQAVAMNAYRNGALEVLSLKGWFSNRSAFVSSFILATYISNKDHELLYGDKKTAQEMEKEDLVKKHHNNLKFLNIGGNQIGGFAINYKEL